MSQHLGVKYGLGGGDTWQFQSFWVCFLSIYHASLRRKGEKISVNNNQFEKMDVSVFI